MKLIKSQEAYNVSYGETDQYHFPVATIEITRYILGFVTAKIYSQGKLIHKGWGLFGNDLSACRGAVVDGVRIYGCWEDASGWVFSNWKYISNASHIRSGIMIYEGDYFFTPGFRRMYDMGYSFTKL